MTVGKAGEEEGPQHKLFHLDDGSGANLTVTIGEGGK